MLELQLHDGRKLVGAQGVEEHDVVETVEELRFERRLHGVHDRFPLLLARQGLVDEELRAQVRRQDQDGVPEVDGASLAVGQPAVVEDLEEDVEDARVSLLHLVEQDDRVRTPAHSLGELSALVVADVAGRGTDEAGHSVLLAVLAHVDADQGLLVVEQEVGQGLRELSLADAGGAEEHERASGPIGIGDARAGPADRVGDGTHGVLLSDQSMPEHALGAEQLLDLTLEQAAGGDARPGGDHLGDVVARHVVADHRIVRFDVGFLGLGELDLLLHRGDLPVEQSGRGLQVGVALSDLGLVAQFVELLLQVTDAVETGTLRLPLRLQFAQLLLLVGEVGAQSLEALLGGGVGFLRQRQVLHLQPVDGASQFVDLDRRGVDLHPQARSRLVDEVDRLVGQLTPGDVAVRQGGRGHQGAVVDRHLVVGLVALLEPAEDRDRVLDGGLTDEHLLEPALQGGVLLDVLPVLIEGGRADEAQLTTGEHRLEHVACVHCGITGGPGSDDRVEFVDERDDLAVRVLDLLEHGLESLLELATVLRAGHHRRQVEADQGLVAQGFRHVSGDDALGEAFDDGGLADAGFADENRIVLRPPRQHLDHTADLGVATDHRVELALAGGSGEVDAVLLQRLHRVLRVLGGDLLASAQVGQRREQGVAVGAGTTQDLSGVLLALGGGEQQVLGRDELVAQGGHLLLRQVHHLECGPGQARLGDGRADHRGQGVDRRFDRLPNGLRVGSDLRHQGRGQGVRLLEQCGDEVGRLDLVVAAGHDVVDRRLQRLPRFGGHLCVHTQLLSGINGSVLDMVNTKKVESIPLNPE